MHSRTKELIEMAREAGLEPIAQFSAGSRLVVEARAGNGVTRQFQLQRKPGDQCGDLNERARMRRFGRENPAPDTETPTPEPSLEADMKGQAKLSVANGASHTASDAAIELTPTEFYKLCEHTKGVAWDQMSDLEAFAQAASTAIGHTVSEATAKEAMEATGTATPEHWMAPLEPHVVLARELSALLTQLGHQPSRHFTRLLEQISREQKA
jgi:hypothetical protein